MRERMRGVISSTNISPAWGLIMGVGSLNGWGCTQQNPLAEPAGGVVGKTGNRAVPSGRPALGQSERVLERELNRQKPGGSACQQRATAQPMAAVQRLAVEPCDGP